ncbi:hypothetical protein [Botryobacter ruber]|uniref:hypothetical protein n=1 Tax=Botryobacter ruber TaxID=2171629 RepID=UPI000FEC4871|nr:hypothetical protein [Botryobacter ruber]
MRLFTLVLVFFSVTAFAQKRVLIQSIRIDNSYAEVAVNPFSKPENEALFLQQLEQKLQERFGPVEVTYLNGQKKIMFLDKVAATKDPRAVMTDFQDLYKAKKNVDRQAYDMRLDLSVELVDVFSGKKDNFQILSKVVARGKDNKKLFKNKGKVHVNIPAIPFGLDQLNAAGATVYEGFPLSEDKLAEAVGSSVALALGQEKEAQEMTVERQAFGGYAAFIDQAVSYKVVAPNDYGDYLYKMRILRLLTFTKHRPLIASRQSDRHGILLGFREKRFTDIGYQVGIPPAYEVGKLHKHFQLYSQFSPEQEEHYSLNTVLTDKKALGAITWSEPIKFRLKDERNGKVGEFSFRVNANTDSPLQQETRSMHRVYHPWASLEGFLEGKTFTMRTNPYLLNAVEIMWGGQLMGLVVHAAAPKQYLRKGKNSLPYFVYFHPECSEAQQEILLQTFQTFHLAKVLHNGQDVTGSRIQ